MNVQSERGRTNGTSANYNAWHFLRLILLKVLFPPNDLIAAGKRAGCVARKTLASSVWAAPNVLAGFYTQINRSHRNGLALAFLLAALLIACPRNQLAFAAEVERGPAITYTALAKAGRVSRSSIEAPHIARAPSAQPNDFTGQVSYDFPVPLPPARSNFGPQLAIHYGAADAAGIAGLGWSIPVPGIQRSTHNGVNYANDEFEYDDATFSADLVKMPDGSFRARVDGPNYRYRIGTAADGKPMWIVDNPAGGQIFLGDSAESRISNPTDDTKIFTWKIAKAIDPNGNVIKYHYRQKDSLSNALLPDSLEYNGHETSGVEDFAPNLQVKFSYEQRPDLLRDASAGFDVVVGLRLTDIVGALNSAPYRAIHLEYNAGTADNLGRTLLKSINERAASGNTITLAKFEYYDQASAYSGGPDTLSLGNLSPQGLRFADIGETGAFDVVSVGAASSDQIKVWAWTSSGYQTYTQEIAGLSDAVRVFLGNFAGTGHLDLLYADPNGNWTVFPFQPNQANLWGLNRSGFAEGHLV
jgi:hypothetical protein